MACERDALDPNELEGERPEDYYLNTAIIGWPLGPQGEAFPIFGTVDSGVVFKDGGGTDAAKELVRFLVAESRLAPYLNFSGERLLPSMAKLLEQPFWLDPSDPHRMAAVMQASRATAGSRLRSGLGQLALRPDLAGVALGQGEPSRSGRGHQPGAGGRRGDRASRRS